MTMINISALMESSGVGFGTSGARGTVEAMTAPVCYAYTTAFLQTMQAQAAIDKGATIVLAGDLRASTPAILAAVSKAILDAGYQLEYAGRIPSPALAYHAINNGCASIMVTGSHIPDDRNGIKFNRPNGEILKNDEVQIRAQSVVLPEPFPDTNESDIPCVQNAATEVYLRRYAEFFAADSLHGLKVGVYQHSGVARDLLGLILEQAGATVIELARSEQFIPVDTEAIRQEDIQLGHRWSAEYALDAIISTDGDADRPLISDQHGNWLRGDIVGVLCAQFLGIETLVTPVSSNTVVEKCGSFKRVYRTRIGSPYVIEQMQQALQKYTGAVAGYEANGGFLLASEVERNGHTLTPLPTRDAVLPMLAILVAAHQQQSSVGALVATLPSRYTASDRLKAFPTEKSNARIEQLSASNTEIESIFGALCGAVTATDSTDGLRITFENNEIIHLRPSGNAPELRCYNEADTPERAESLNKDCLQLMAGWR